METSPYDIAIVGGGPIGAAAAYFLSQSKNGKRVGLISSENRLNLPIERFNQNDNDEDPEHRATYLYAGGSVRWHFEDPEISRITSVTADFIRARLAEGVDLAALEDAYVFLNRGSIIPSFTVSGAKLAEHLAGEAEKNGVARHQGTTLRVCGKKNNLYALDTDQGEILANKVLLALGPSLNHFVPEAGFEFEKRQAFVLDVPVPPERVHFPHLILPLHGGIAYVFVKKIGMEFKMVLSQEGIIEENKEPTPHDYFPALCDLGLTNILPFLKGAAVEKVLWGFDAKNKKVKIYSPDQQLFAAACGSAVRSSIGIGQELAAKLAH